MTDSKPVRLRDVPDAHLRAIGLVALQWSALETTMFRMIAICSLADIDECRAFLTHMNFPQKCDVMATMIGLACPNSADHAEVRKFADNLKKNLAPKRNGIVHQDLWPDGADAELISGYSYRARGELLETEIKLRETDILAVADEIGRTSHELVKLWEKVFPAVRARHQFHRELLKADFDASPDKSETRD